MLDPIRQTLVNLLTGYGYNLYEKKNRARADDLLVREKAAEMVAEAANGLRALRTAFQKRYIPPPTRDAPTPPPERLAQLRALADLHRQLDDLAARIRGMVVPTQDRVWERVRSEQALLHELLRHDYDLIAPCRELREAVDALDLSTWNDASLEPVAAITARIERAVRARAEFLRVPGW